MRKNIFIAIAVLVAIILSGTVFARPPKVVMSVPANGELNVDAGLKTMRVVFDQEMNTKGGFSICGGGERFPLAPGRPKWVGKKTITMKLDLKPGREYSLSINCQSAGNFKNMLGESAEVYPISFRTSGVQGNFNASGEQKKLNFMAINKLQYAIDEKYSYRDLSGVDWDKTFSIYAPKLNRCRTPEQFAQITVKMLSKARDAHIWVKLNDKKIPGGFRPKTISNYSITLLSKIVPQWKKRNKIISSGRFDNDIGYILISSWSIHDKQLQKAAFQALRELSDTRALIIDVRPNGGGSEALAREFAGCFIDKSAVYAKHVYRNANAAEGWTQIQKRILTPNKDRLKYRGKIAILMGQANMSSCEAFLLMMKQVPNCKLIGETSYGSSGNPKPYDLGNGVTVWLPSWKALRPDETCFEGQGIKPDITIRTNERQLRAEDPVLESALRYLRSSL